MLFRVRFGRGSASYPIEIADAHRTAAGAGQQWLAQHNFSPAKPVVSLVDMTAS